MEKVYKNHVVWTKTEIHYRMADVTEDLDSALRIF